VSYSTESLSTALSSLRNLYTPNIKVLLHFTDFTIVSYSKANIMDFLFAKPGIFSTTEQIASHVSISAAVFDFPNLKYNLNLGA